MVSRAAAAASGLVSDPAAASGRLPFSGPRVGSCRVLDAADCRVAVRLGTGGDPEVAAAIEMLSWPGLDAELVFSGTLESA